MGKTSLCSAVRQKPMDGTLATIAEYKRNPMPRREIHNSGINAHGDEILVKAEVRAVEECGFELVLRGCQPGPLGGWRLVRGGALIDHTTRTSDWLAAGPKDGPLLQNRGHKDVFGAPGWQPDSAEGVAAIVTAVIWPMPDRLNRGILRNEKEGLETIDGSLWVFSRRHWMSLREYMTITGLISLAASCTKGFCRAGTKPGLPPQLRTNSSASSMTSGWQPRTFMYAAMHFCMSCSRRPTTRCLGIVTDSPASLWS